MTQDTTTKTAQQMLREFNEAMDLTEWVMLPDAHAKKEFWTLRMSLIEEEFSELMDELLDSLNGRGSRRKIAKEAADLHYVLYQLEELLLIDSAATFAEVHRSNMSKLGDDGKPVRRDDGKILKGPNYTPADLDRIVP